MAVQYILDSSESDHRFRDGLVFGFDVGTGSIGHAVRKGTHFLDVGVLICDSEGSDLSKRRDLRRQRRTLRSKKYRRKWFSDELTKLGLPRPIQFPDNPIELRLRALNGEKLPAENLHAAFTHLFKRRGYTKVPWASNSANTDSEKPKRKDDDEGVILEAVSEMKANLADRHPSQYLADKADQVGRSPTDKWARKIYWPREALEAEFRAIVNAQAAHFPILVEKIDLLLYGDTQVKQRNGQDFHVFFKNTQARNPGVLGLRWPRFDNRSPALDSLYPLDEEGRSLHVVRKNKKAFSNAQWELAIMNFRVLDVETRQKIDPRVHFPEFIDNLQNEWNKSKKVTVARLSKLALPFEKKFLLIENQKALTPETGSGRARYSSPTLNIIREEINAGRRVDPPQPILRRGGENAETALNRYLADIGHPLVRHRLVLFRRILADLIQKHGEPDMIVLEAARNLALGNKAKIELNRRAEQFRKDRETARGDLAAAGKSISRKAITRYRLWKEAQSTCPFCCEKITQAQLLNGEADIEHLVPRAQVDCSEFYNLTVGHLHCNREVKGNRTPYNAFSSNLERWAQLQANAQKCFTGRKLEIFLSPNAEELIERKADLQHTAYIARVVRHIALLQLGWLNQEGRDPTPEKQNPALRFQVTNGQLTSRLRGAWGLNQILHPLPPGRKWDDLSEEEKLQFGEKNRGDLRHHALDAMVIACTLPWLAHRTYGAKDEAGNHGWWTQDEKQRSKAANPVFPKAGQMHQVCKSEIEKVVACHHVSRSNHRRAYDTTIYGKKADDVYVAREKLDNLNEKDLKKVYPTPLAVYLAAAWEKFQDETQDLSSILKTTKGKLPDLFIEKLCFSHFQRWRENKPSFFEWASTIQIPIRNVKYVGVNSDSAVAPSSPGSQGFVARNSFKEVRIHQSIDGKGLVPVFVPRGKKDRLIHGQPFQTGRPIKVIRLGDLIELKDGYGANNPPGIYRVVSTMQKQIQLLPPNVADTKEALRAAGYLENGINLRWPAFFKASGYELPHPSSSQP